MKSKERLLMYTKDEKLMLNEIKALKARGFKSFRNELNVGDEDMSLSPPKSGSDYDYDELEKEYGENPLDDASNLNVSHNKTDNLFGRGKESQETSKHISFLHSTKEEHHKPNYT